MKRQNNPYEEWKVRENLVDFGIRNYHIISLWTLLNNEQPLRNIADGKMCAVIWVFHQKMGCYFHTPNITKKIGD